MCIRDRPVAEQAAEPERVPLTVQSYIHVERLKGKPKGLIVVPFEGWVNETNEIAYKGNQKIYLLKNNFINTLPRGGEEGTLKERDLPSNAYMKTGSLSGVSTL